MDIGVIIYANLSWFLFALRPYAGLDERREGESPESCGIYNIRSTSHEQESLSS